MATTTSGVLTHQAHERISMWHPNIRATGIAGILAGLALTGEFVFFGASGFAQDTFNDPSTALGFLRDHGQKGRRRCRSRPCSSESLATLATAWWR